MRAKSETTFKSAAETNDFSGIGMNGMIECRQKRAHGIQINKSQADGDHSCTLISATLMASSRLGSAVSSETLHGRHTDRAGSACCGPGTRGIGGRGGGSSLPADGLSRRLGGGEGCPARLVFAGETLGPIRSLGNVGVAALAHTSGRPGDHKGITMNDQYRYRLPTPREGCRPWGGAKHLLRDGSQDEDVGLLP